MALRNRTISQLNATAIARLTLGLCERQSDRSGKYWSSSPLVFSFVPRCHGLRGSQM
jgi:hypothetical protein